MRRPRELTVAVGANITVTALVYDAGEPSQDATLILAHGAGAGQRSPFMVGMAEALASRGLDVVTFNFPYAQQGRRLPDRQPVLEACYLAVVEKIRAEVPSAMRRLFVGGKSMGGRIATHAAQARADLRIAGLVLLGYPLHPPGQPEKRRDAHLSGLRRPMLVIQGSRDVFGTPEELRPVLNLLAPAPLLHVVDGGDHSFTVPRAGASGRAAIHDAIERTIVEWIRSVPISES